MRLLELILSYNKERNGGGVRVLFDKRMREWCHWLWKLVDVEGKYLAIVSMLVSVLGAECVNWM